MHAARALIAYALLEWPKARRPALGAIATAAALSMTTEVLGMGAATAAWRLPLLLLRAASAWARGQLYRYHAGAMCSLALCALWPHLRYGAFRLTCPQIRPDRQTRRTARRTARRLRRRLAKASPHSANPRPCDAHQGERETPYQSQPKRITPRNALPMPAQDYAPSADTCRPFSPGDYALPSTRMPRGPWRRAR
jgi:hypothetical protein